MVCFLFHNFAEISIMRKIEHIGIAVKDLAASNTLFEQLLGQPPYKEEEVASEGVKTSFFMNGPNKIELLEATNPESPIAKFLEKKGNISNKANSKNKFVRLHNYFMLSGRVFFLPIWMQISLGLFCFNDF